MSDRKRRNLFYAYFVNALATMLCELCLLLRGILLEEL